MCGESGINPPVWTADLDFLSALSDRKPTRHSPQHPHTVLVQCRCQVHHRQRASGCWACASPRKSSTRASLYQYVQFYRMFPEIAQTASAQSLPRLSWSHYIEPLRVKDDRARARYEREAANQGWSVKALRPLRLSPREESLQHEPPIRVPALACRGRLDNALLRAIRIVYAQ